VLITAVDRGGPAAAAEIQRGMVLTSLDGQATEDVVATAKRLYAKARGEKTHLELIIPVQRGGFVQFTRATAEFAVR